SNNLITRKVQDIPSGYDPSLYQTKRLMVRARDGAMVPVSFVERKDRQTAGPIHLYAYGAYGHGMSPGFSISRLSLLERKVGFAIAHIRGGDELGYGWYEAGKGAKRWNTFNDFFDVADALIEQKVTSRGKIAISGGSAGGKLMGVAINERPELWGAVVADVPFVDVLSTMLDDTLPLTPIEWPEWGNPIEDEGAYDYILSYSPYDNVRAQSVPPIMITAGLSDPRVTYWEPAKWAARLRAMKTNDAVLVLKTNMEAGHGGKSGRYDAIDEVAESQAFMLVSLGIA
ncbi:MAG: prolyl oligopeptidase family serine peptidase, partial [Pseudomonadota bacterium]